jgi:RNHCP domain
MRPIGLTTKHSRNRYATERDGELMVVHQCIACETIILNRIAADDSAASLLEIYESSYAGGVALQAVLHNSGVAILTARDRDLVRRRLYGQSQNR